MLPITVMIPVRNAELFLQDTIDSVLCQTFTNFELLLLDDGSTDRSSEIIQSYSDPRIQYIRCAHNFIKTLNAGLSLINSKYIALMDHDDLMVPYRLKKQYVYMEAHPGISACGGYFHSFGQYARPMNVPLQHKDILLSMLTYCSMLNTTGFVRMEALTSNSIKYKRGYSYSADYKFWADIARTGVIVNIPEIFTLYRVHNKQASRKYARQCEQGGNKVKLEVLEYLLSHIKKDKKFGAMIVQEFIPALDEVGQTGCFSGEVFFQFMYELMSSLIEKGAIDV